MEYILTKEFRHELYKKALEAYLDPKLYQWGLCNAIEQAHHFLQYGNFVSPFGHWKRRTWPLLCGNEENYPELSKYKPEDCGCYWFPLEDNKIRIFIFTQAIEETRP